MEATGGELQARHLGAAERLLRLSIDHGLAVTALLAALAHELFELDLRHWEELAAAAEPDLPRRRAEHAGRIAARLVECAARLVELGGEMRSGFSRLLTEQLAAGNHGLMDAFQGYFAVLPAQGGEDRQMLALAAARAERAIGEVEAVLARAVPAVAAGTPARLLAPAPAPALPAGAAPATDRSAAVN